MKWNQQIFTLLNYFTVYYFCFDKNTLCDKTFSEECIVTASTSALNLKKQLVSVYKAPFLVTTVVHLSILTYIKGNRMYCLDTLLVSLSLLTFLPIG